MKNNPTYWIKIWTVIFIIIVIYFIFTIHLQTNNGNFNTKKDNDTIDYKAVGELQFKDNNLLLAIKSFNEHVKNNPLDDDVYAEMGLIYYDLDNFSKAEFYFNKTLTINQNNSKGHLGLAKLYLIQNEMQKANNKIKLAFHDQENLYWKYLELAITYFRIDRFNESNNLLIKADLLQPNNELIQNLLGWTYYEINDLNNALYYFNKTLSLNNKNDLAFAGIGTVYIKQGKIDDAVVMFNSSLLINPNNTVAYYKLGRIYYEDGDFEKSKKVLNKAITLLITQGQKKDQKSLKSLESSYQLMGLIYLYQNDISLSEKYFELSLELNSNIKDKDYTVLNKSEVIKLLREINETKK